MCAQRKLKSASASSQSAQSVRRPHLETLHPWQSKMRPVYRDKELELQYNLNGSNTDGSNTLDDSNSFFSPYKILPIARENK